MGVPQFLSEVLPSCGRPIDLNAFLSEAKTIRIGVDLSSWIYKACVGFGDMLGDERHLSNFGRAHLIMDPQPEDNNNNNEESYIRSCTAFVMQHLKVLKATKAEILVVLDGATPPIKLKEVQERSKKRKQAEIVRDQPVNMMGGDEQERIKAFRTAGAGKHYSKVVASIIAAMREEQICFMVAPYEADSQLGYLSRQKLIDLVITEDSDMVALATPLLYKLTDNIGSGDCRGILLQRECLGACVKMDFTDVSPLMLSVAFCCVGSDYCPKLRGIGIMGALRIVRDAFLTNNPLQNVLNRLFQETWDKDLDDNYREIYQVQFVSAVLQYRHPVVFDPITATCITVGLDKPDPELATHELYQSLLQHACAREKVTGTLFHRALAIAIAEGYVSPRTQKPYSSEQPLPKYYQQLLYPPSHSWWKQERIPSPQDIRPILEKLGVWRKNNTLVVRDLNFESLQGLRKFFCRYGVLRSNKLLSQEMTLLERWISFANFPGDDARTVALPQSQDEILSLLKHHGFRIDAVDHTPVHRYFEVTPSVITVPDDELECLEAGDMEHGHHYFSLDELHTAVRVCVRGSWILEPVSENEEDTKKYQELRLWGATAAEDLPDLLDLPSKGLKGNLMLQAMKDPDN